MAGKSPSHNQPYNYSEESPNNNNARGAAIDCLPDELILQILSYLVDEKVLSPSYDMTRARAKLLLPLCLVNRQFSRATVGLLYEKLEFPRTSGAADRLLHILKTIPSLGAFVREVGYHSRVDERLPDFQELFRFASSRYIPKHPRWADREAALASLLCLTPNVTTIIKLIEREDEETNSLPPHVPSWLKPILHASMGSSFGPTHQFSRLRSLHMYLSNVPLSKVSTILQLPSLRGLEYHSWYDADSETDLSLSETWGCSFATSEVQHLRLYFGMRESIVDISKTVVSCKCLISFHLTLNPFQHVTALFSTIVPALQKHSQSLESLQFEELSTMHYERPFYGLLPSLRAFRAVRILKIPLDVMIGSKDLSSSKRLDISDYFPASLEVLFIDVGAGKRREPWVPNLRRFLGALATVVPIHLPRLGRLGLFIKSFDRSAAPLDFIAIKKQFADLNVHFGWVVKLFGVPTNIYEAEVEFQRANGTGGIEIASRFLPWFGTTRYPDMVLSPEEDLFPSRDI